MTPDQITLVRDTFKPVAAIREDAAALFYGRLFEIAPDVRPLFKSDLTAQGAKLMNAIGMVVASLDRIEQVLPQVQEMAVRHVAYGVEDRHYAVVGDALIWTLDKGLGDQFTPAARDAWLKAYDTLSGAMITAARAAAEPDSREA